MGSGQDDVADSQTLPFSEDTIETQPRSRLDELYADAAAKEEGSGKEPEESEDPEAAPVAWLRVDEPVWKRAIDWAKIGYLPGRAIEYILDGNRRGAIASLRYHDEWERVREQRESEEGD